MTEAKIKGVTLPQVGVRYEDRKINYRRLRVTGVNPGASHQREVVGILTYAHGHEQHEHHGREYSVDLARFWAIWKDPNGGVR